MKLIDYFRLILIDIKRRKFSSILTFIAILFGIYSIILIYNFGDSFQESVNREFLEFGTNRIILSIEDDTNNYSKNIINTIEKSKYVLSAYPISQTKASVFSKSRNKAISLSIVGSEFSKKAFDTYQLDIEFGRYPKKTDNYKTIIGSRVSEKYFDNRVRVSSKILINNVSFEVIGILEEVGNDEDDTVLYISQDSFSEVFNKENIGSVFITTYEFLDIEDATKDIENKLRREYGKDYNSYFSILTFKQIIESSKNILDIIKYVFLGLSIVTLIVGFLGTANIMYSFVDEKIKDIGIMKSIGATDKNILFLFILFSGLYGLLGATAGITLGHITLFFLKDVGKLLGMSFFVVTININYSIFLIFFGFIVGCLSGYFPAKKASKLSIIDSIRK